MGIKKEGVMEKILEDAERKMNKSLDVISQQLARLRSGKASPSLLDGIKVDYYGTPTLINQIASISAPEPRLLVVHPWDKSAISNVEKAILSSDLGLNPNSDGNVVRIPIPPLTEERRRELVKIAKNIAEEGKIGLRNIRREIIDFIKTQQKEGEIPEDDSFRLQDRVQDITEKHSKKIEELFKLKEEEIMTM